MKLIKKAKKGFTLIELVVVIAVIAILVAVSVVSYLSITNKAKESHDNQIIDQVNLSLKANETLNGKPKTMYKALEGLKEDGFLPANFGDLRGTAKDYEFAYSLKENKFVALKKDKISYPEGVGEHEKYELWKIAETTSNLKDNYSHYLRGTSLEGAVDVDAGLDVGDNIGITAINYSNPSGNRNSVIRTNGGTLNITAPEDTVTHYGTADKVDIKKINHSSYHEAGTVALIAIKEGHAEVESGSDVNGIYVYNDSTSETKDTSFANVKITVKTTEVPKLSRSAVQIQDGGTKVCTIVTDQAKDVYLFQDGIYEQIKTVDEGKTLSDSSASWADNDSKNTDKTQSAAQQLANEWTGEVAPVWSSYDETRALEDITNKEEVAGLPSGASEEEIQEAIEAKVVDGGKTAEEAETATLLKGTGSARDPFQIYDFATMQKISEFYDMGYYYYEVVLEKTDNGKIDCSGWSPVYLNGSFNGKGVKFTNVTACLFMSVGHELESQNLVLENFEATMNVSSNGEYGAAALIKNIFNAGVTTFSNVKVHGYLEGYWNMGSFYNYGTCNYDDVGCDYEVVFNNCYSDATLVCASGNTIGGLFGHAYEGAGHSFTLRVNNTEYAGQMFLTTTSGKGNKYYGMTSDYYNANNHFYFDGVEDTFDNGSSKNAGAYTNSVKISEVKASKQSGGYMVAKQTNASRIVATITAQLTAYDSSNVKIDNLSGITMTLSSVELTELGASDVKVLDLFNSVSITRYAQSYGARVSSGVLNVDIASTANYKSGVVRIQVNQYDATGTIISAGTLDIASCADATSAWVVK